MLRLTSKQYQRHVTVAMSVYVAFMLLAWPLVRTPIDMVWKVVLSLAAALPVIYVIGMLARRIRDSDELEQRTHLIALGVATLVVNVLSLVCGFLASSGVWGIDGTILIWVFPLMMLTYACTRGWVARRYGTSMMCEDESGVPTYLRFLGLAVLLFGLAFFERHRLSDESLGLLLGMASTFLLGGIVFGILRWRRQHADAASCP